MKKPHEEMLRVEGCGNPAHGPERSCWKVVNGHGGRPLQGVTKDVATLYAATTDMALELLADGRMTNGGDWHTQECWYAHAPSECLPRCASKRAALKKAGALE